jgi:hypothetical protein
VVGRWIRLVQADTLRPQAISTATRAAILDRFPTPTLSTIGPSRGPCFASEEWDERVCGAYGDLRYTRLPASRTATIPTNVLRLNQTFEPAPERSER